MDLKRGERLERVLIIRNQGIGDLILITPAIRAVRSLHPDVHIAILVGEWSRPAVEGNPHLNEIISYPDPWIQNKQPLGYLRLAARLLRKRFDAAYVFHSHPLIHLLPALAGIARRYGFYDLDLGKKGGLLTEKTAWQPNTDRYIADNYLDVPRLAGYQGTDLALDLRLNQDEQDQADRLLTDYGLAAGDFIVVAPGGGINPRQNVFAKRWGSAKYAELCGLLHRHWAASIILVGSGAEAEIGREIAQSAGAQVIDLIGKTSFRQTAALIRRSRLLISNDSSVMHVAVAFRISSLSIFGPSNPRSLLPVSRLNQWIRCGVECSPCYCNGIFRDCDHLRCMNELSASSVWDRLEQMRRETIEPNAAAS